MINNSEKLFIKADKFIQLKDHEENFKTKITCKLLNPITSNIGNLSKQILEKYTQN